MLYTGQRTITTAAPGTADHIARHDVTCQLIYRSTWEANRFFRSCCPILSEEVGSSFLSNSNTRPGEYSKNKSRPLTANLRWRPFSSVPHVSDRLELHNNNRASWILHPGPSESDVYSDVVQEARWNDLLHTARLSMRLDTPLHGNNARGAKYAVYYASVATHTVFENIKMAALRAMSEEKCCSPFPCFFIPWQKYSVGVVTPVPPKSLMSKRFFINFDKNTCYLRCPKPSRSSIHEDH